MADAGTVEKVWLVVGVEERKEERSKVEGSEIYTRSEQICR